MKLKKIIKIWRKISLILNLWRKIIFDYNFSLGINTSPGDYSEEVIPDPIPNSEVKLSAPMVLCLKTWKSRTLPG